MPQEGIENVHAKNGYASATPVTDGQLHLRVVRPARARRVRSRPARSSGIAASASSTTITAPPDRPCSTRTASFLYQDHERLDCAARLRRRLRHGDRARRSGRRRAPRPSAGERPSSSAPALATSWSSTASAASRPTIRDRPGAVDGARHDVRGDSDTRWSARISCSRRRAAPVRRSRSVRAAAATSRRPTSRGARSAARPSCRPASSHDGLLYLINDMQSILTVYDAKTGDARLSGPAGRRAARGLLGVARRRQRRAVLHQRRWRDVRGGGGARVQAAAHDVARRTHAGVAGAGRWRVVLENGQQFGGDSVRMKGPPEIF